MSSKSLLVVLVVFLLSDSLDAQRDKKFFRDDYTYIDAIGSFYKVHTTDLTWYDARRVCAQEGASLFHPENDNEANSVMSYFQTVITNDLFVGISSLLAPGVVENIDGKLMSELYHNWRSNEPNNVGGTQNCGMMNHDSNVLYLGPCRNKLPFICKKNLQWNYLCHMFDFDYTFDSDTGNCYKLHTTPLNWTDAHAACRAERSYLAVINNQLEADYLANLTKSALNQRVRGNYYRGIYHLGFHNKYDDGWQTLTGTPMNVECEAWWDNHEPIPDEHNQCGSMFFNGRLNTVSCDTKSFFICEHEVDHSSLYLESSTLI